MLNLEQVEKAIEKGIITFITDPNMNEGTVCSIGEYWFYCWTTTSMNEFFTDHSPKEIISTIPTTFLALLVFVVLEEFRNTPDFVDEYNYYNSYIIEQLNE